MKSKKILFLTLLIFLSSCSTMKEGFSNQKKNSSDEFLVEKKSPLVMPPNYDDLPIPNTNQIEPEDKDGSQKLKKLISSNENNENSEVDLDSNGQGIENSILKKIKNK